MKNRENLIKEEIIHIKGKIKVTTPHSQCETTNPSPKDLICEGIKAICINHSHAAMQEVVNSILEEITPDWEEKIKRHFQSL